MATTKADGAAAAARREAARRLQEAAQKRAEQAAAAAKAAKAAAAAKKSKTVKGFGKDELSTGKGGALRRAATNRLGSLGLDPTQRSAAVGQTYKANQVASAQLGGPDAVKDAATLSKVKDPAARAKALDALVTKNPDPVYQRALLAAAKPAIEDLARQVTDKNSGASTATRQAALDSLASATEKLSPDAQKDLATTFAGTMKDGNVGDDANEFGTLLKNSVKDGSGASFGVLLASQLQSSGKTTAANDSSKFVGQGISDVRKAFDDANKKVDELHAKLGQELATWQLNGTDQATALKQFNADNHLDDATQELEKQGALLASVENGAALAVSDPALKDGASQTRPAGRGVSMPRFGNESDLLAAAKGSLLDVPALAGTRAGSAAIATAVAQSGEGKPSFLDHVVEQAEKGEAADSLANTLRSSVVQAVGAHLLSSAQNGTFEADKSAILKGLNANRALFGATEKQMQGFTDALGAFKPGMTDKELKAATSAVGDKISELGEGGGPVAQSLKGLSVVFGTIAAVKDWSNFADADVKEKIATISNTLSVGSEGADLITGTLSRFAGNSAAEAAEGTALAETAGLTAGKLLGAGIGALGTVVSGWQAFDAFKDGNVQAGVGDSLAAIGGAVATVGLFLDGTIAGAPAGVVLNVVGGVLAAAGTVVTLFASPPNPFEGQEKDLGKILESLGVKKEVADKLKDFNGDGQNFGTWVSAVAKKLNISTGDFVRSMNNWSPQQVTDFLDAARLQHDTDDNNSNRRNDAAAVLGKDTANALEDPNFVDYRTGKVVDKLNEQKRLREKVDEKTGAVTYADDLIARAAQWVRDGLPT